MLGRRGFDCHDFRCLRVGREFWFARVFNPSWAEDVLIVTTSDVCTWGESSGSPESSIHVGLKRR